jgi:hypothetical protein
MRFIAEDYRESVLLYKSLQEKPPADELRIHFEEDRPRRKGEVE